MTLIYSTRSHSTELFLSKYIKEAQYLDDSSLYRFIVRGRIVNKHKEEVNTALTSLNYKNMKVVRTALTFLKIN